MSTTIASSSSSAFENPTALSASASLVTSPTGSDDTTAERSMLSTTLSMNGASPTTDNIHHHHHDYPPCDNDDAVSVISTTCSSVEGEDHPLDRSTRAAKKRAIWKDKGGQARYTLNGDNQKMDDTANNKNGVKPKNAIAAAAVTAGVVTGGVVGAVLLGPVGLVVGGVGGVGSAASALVTQRRMAFQRQRQRVREEQTGVRRSTSPVPEPPCRSFSGHHTAGDNSNAISDVHDTKASF